eukprot:gnl/TRDRNA2_/TRDRNA2_94572_c0_seq1.p1 gnl/TRDRNA2_/TRDRNA2_94572_c0~~gnl/TRDRNA2_/TRDRNA2_94572_c0_seq1.p1  ORF type:complete len:335 (-),score=61.19 gnl/TRDRNA2_/TRDRNA2_94572_c0_seq1:200-1204(-)
MRALSTCLRRLPRQHAVQHPLAASSRSESAIAAPHVLAIGNTIMDTVLTMPHLPIDDKVFVDSKKTYVGGQGANAAQAMALLGLSTSFLTRLGDDDLGDVASRHFRAMGLAPLTVVAPGALTMSATVAVATEDQQRSCLMHRDPKMFDHDITGSIEAVLSSVSSFHAVYTDGWQLDMVLPIVRKAAELDLPIVADIEVVDAETRSLAALASELVAPAKVVCTLAEEDDPAVAVTKLAAASRAGATVIATCGSDGSYGACHGDREACYVPACTDVKVVDTTGAGDAYHAGYTAALCHRQSLQDAMIFATRVAAASCETPGPVVSVEALKRWGMLL